MLITIEFLKKIAIAIGDPFNVLLADVELAEALIDENDFSKRNYIRTYFAFVEGSIFIMKQVCFEFGKLFNSLSVEDAALLRDCTFEVNDKGIAFEQVKYIKLQDNVKYLVNVSNKILGLNQVLDTKCPEHWWDTATPVARSVPKRKRDRWA